jgi:hypothetical protein
VSSSKYIVVLPLLSTPNNALITLAVESPALVNKSLNVSPACSPTCATASAASPATFLPNFARVETAPQAVSIKPETSDDPPDVFAYEIPLIESLVPGNLPAPPPRVVPPPPDAVPNDEPPLLESTSISPVLTSAGPVYT